MDQEKKPIEAFEENQNVREALEQTSTSACESDFTEDEVALEAPTILTEENGMANNKDKKVLPLAKRRFRTVIALLVAIVIFIGGTIGVSFIPEEEKEFTTTPANTIYVKKTPTENIEKIAVNGSFGKMVFVSKKDAAETSSDSSESTETYSWELQGYDQELISSSAVNAAADNLATITATRIMEQDQSKKALYGLDRPVAMAEVFVRNGENYTLTVGDASPDASGYYASVSGDPKIYLIAAGGINNFNTSPEAMANTVILSPPTIDNVAKKSDKKYFDEETGSLATFDSIELSGPKYGQKVVITPVADNEFVEYSIDLGTYSRYADPDVVEEMFSLMGNGLVAIETYKLSPSAADIKKYGLDAPELFITINYGSSRTHLKASMYDKENQYYAVMLEGRNVIYAVTADALSMLENELVDYYYEFVFQEFIYNFKNITVETKDKTYTFDIKHNTSDDTFTATSNGREIDDALLSAYYQYFLTLAPEVKNSYTDGETALKATFTYKDSSKGQIVLELVKQSARRYLVRINGNDYGLVNSTALDYLVVYAEYVMIDKGIPEPV